jgi:hypothetical protein
MTPPIGTVRDVLKLVVGGAFSVDPDAAVSDLRPAQREALVWAVQEGLVDEREIALTDKGRRFYTIIGGAL